MPSNYRGKIKTQSKAKRKKRVRRLVQIVCGFICLMLMGISVAGPLTAAEKDPEAEIHERVEQLMKAKVSDDWETVYNLYNNAYRESITKTNFLRKPRNMVYKEFEIDGIDVLPTGTEANVTVKSGFMIQGYEIKDAPEKQKWVKEEGQWFQKVNPEDAKQF